MEIIRKIKNRFIRSSVTLLLCAFVTLLLCSSANAWTVGKPPLGNTAIAGNLTVTNNSATGICLYDSITGDKVFCLDSQDTTTDGVLSVYDDHGAQRGDIGIYKWAAAAGVGAQLRLHKVCGANDQDTFGACSGTADEHISGIYTYASDGGNLKNIARIVVDAEGITTLTIESNATVCQTDSGVLQVKTVALHGLAVNDRVQFEAGTGAVCTGITAATDYWVSQVDSTTTFNISASRGGSSIAYTNAGTAFTTNTFAIKSIMYFSTSDGTINSTNIFLAADTRQNLHIGYPGGTDVLDGGIQGGIRFTNSTDSTPSETLVDGSACVEADYAAGDSRLVCYSEASTTNKTWFGGGSIILSNADESIVSGVLYSNATAVGNVGAGTDIMKTYTIPANTLAVNGDSIRVTAWGFFVGSATNQNRYVRCYFGTALVVGSSVGVSVPTGETWPWIAEYLIMRRGASSQSKRGTMSYYDEGASTSTLSVQEGSTFTSAQNEATALAVECKGTSANAADNDVVQEGMTIEYLPAKAD